MFPQAQPGKAEGLDGFGPGQAVSGSFQGGEAQDAELAASCGIGAASGRKHARERGELELGESGTGGSEFCYLTLGGGMFFN